jgi:uncharacterized membrane protein
MDREPSLVVPGLLLGVGLGGFVDGIVLHQILQWHHMLSEVDRYPPTTVAGLEANTLADGLFHAAAWVAVAVGLLLMRRRPSRNRPALLGLLLAGWGVFNLVEGVVDHHLLGLHHVRHGPAQGWYDAAFLALGVLLVVGGWALYRRADTRVDGPVPRRRTELSGRT